MIYNGFIIVDTHGIDDPNVNPFKEWKEESGVYSVPAGPGGGGSTPPTYGPFMTSAPSGGSGSTPGTPSTPSAPSGGGGTNWLTPETVAAGTNLLGGIIGTVGQVRASNPDKARIKAVCGRKPLFNIGGKKDTYQQCVQNLMMPQPQQQRFDASQSGGGGMSTNTKVIIGVMAFLVLLAIIITIVVLMKRNTAKTV